MATNKQRQPLNYVSVLSGEDHTKTAAEDHGFTARGFGRQISKLRMEY